MHSKMHIIDLRTKNGNANIRKVKCNLKRRVNPRHLRNICICQSQDYRQINKQLKMTFLATFHVIYIHYIQIHWILKNRKLESTHTLKK